MDGGRERERERERGEAGGAGRDSDATLATEMCSGQNGKMSVPRTAGGGAVVFKCFGYATLEVLRFEFEVLAQL